MVCPKCGFMMDAFATDCPRCHGNGVEQPVRPVQQPPQPALPPSSVYQQPPPPWQQPASGYQQPQPYRLQPAPEPSYSADDPLSMGLLLFYVFLSFFVPLAGVFFYFGIRGRSPSQARGMMACAIAGFVISCAVLAGESSPTPVSVSGSLDTPSSVSAPADDSASAPADDSASTSADDSASAPADDSASAPADDSASTSSNASASNSGDCYEDLCVQSISSRSDDFATHITGTVVNSGDKAYSSVWVEINLYDSSGAQVGSTSDTVSNLEPHGRWNFDAMSGSQNATTYKLKEIKAW